ncbi:MAG TPA: hypothetical protein VF132_12485, partial [Rudaea sp.]
MTFRSSPFLIHLCALLLLSTLPGAALACSGRLHIEVAEPGVYALDYDTIVARQPGLAGCASADLRLTQRDQEVPIRIEGDAEGHLRPGSRLLWVGTALHGPQSWFDPYS